MGILRGHFVGTIASLRGYSGITLDLPWGLLWQYFWVILRIPRRFFGWYPGVTLTVPWNDFGITLELLSMYFWGRFGVDWGHFEGTLESLWIYVWHFFKGSLG